MAVALFFILLQLDQENRVQALELFVYKFFRVESSNPFILIVSMQYHIFSY